MANIDNHILITGGAGFVGQALLTALLSSSPTLHITTTDIIEPPIPAASTQDAHRITPIRADLANRSEVHTVLTRRFSAVYILHGLMSGGSEADLELGLRVNVDSVRNVLDYLRREYPGTVVVFTSSCAVYGPARMVYESETVPRPQTSYGAEKLIVELLVDDFSRKGLLDGRIVRLPTVIVRPGKPSAAASSFASGIVRESLKGIPNILPISKDEEIWVCSPRTVVKNLVKIKDVPAEKFGNTRIVNLPGITVKVQQILDALEEVGGKKARALVTEQRDEGIERIVGSWSTRFDVTRAYGLGLEQDGSVVDAVRAFAESLSQEMNGA
ncbi:Fc.00g080460.m01.CDS01 [Cosmosporella sp. VM-42]